MTVGKRILYVIGLVIVPLAIIGAVHFLTNWEMSLTFFYLIPIAFASLLGGYKGGIACCIAASAIFFSHQLAIHGHSLGLAIWNTAMRLLTFLVVGIFLPVAVEEVRRIYKDQQ